jgi:hypothetical protein
VQRGLGQMQCNGRAQDGDIDWRRGDVDERPRKVNVLISLGDGFVEDVCSDSMVYAMACDDGLLDWLCFSLTNGWLGQTLGF